MPDFIHVIKSALANIGIAPQSINNAMDGGELYGNDGVLDSLEFVRFLSEMTQLLDGIQIDLFDLVEKLDAGLSSTFQSVEALSSYLAKALSETAE